MPEDLTADLYGPLFGDPAVADHFSPRACLQAMLDVESALSEVEADLGIIPASAVAPITAAAKADLYDRGAIAEEAVAAGNLAIPLVRHFTREVAALDADAARYVHWGTTSQDLLDTGLVLQLQAAVPVITAAIARAIAAAAAHARRHVDAVMPGRTWLQQATPITFGLKAAGWCDALDRQRLTVAAALEGARVLQFGGASGTLAALGVAGPCVADRLGERLGLRVPDLPWHAHRDRLVQLACALGTLCGTCGKIARDLALLAQTEVGEASETRAAGGGSSTMPHKRNPVAASVVLAASVRAPGLVATLLAAMPQEHERGVGGWQAEWSTLPELVRLSGGAARATAEALEGLAVNPERMRANADLTRGLLAAEAVTMALARHVGRPRAHEVVEEASRRAITARLPLADVLVTDPRVTEYLTPDEIHERLDPNTYLGAAQTFVARVLERRTGG